MKLFRQLTPAEEQQFRHWAQVNFRHDQTPNSLWHPVIHDEWAKLLAVYQEGVRRAEEQLLDVVALEMFGEGISGLDF